MQNVLLVIAVLACPVGMGAMMWFMSKGMRQPRQPPAAPEQPIDKLRAQQRRLAAKIDRLESANADADDRLDVRA